MSLIVKRMSLPRSCSTCRFSYFTVGIKKRCEIFGDEVNPLIDHREINCPLSEIPTPHGRLIDADALIKDLQGLRELFPSSNIDYFGGVISLVKNSPTIIETEVSE